jgi:hypothetical protein
LVKTIETEGDAIVESESGAKVAVIPYDEFLELQEQRKNRLREEAYVRLQEALKGQDERNADLTEEEIEELADRATREAIDELAAEGKLVFERDQK